MREDNVQVILGLKLRQFREERDYTLKEVAQLAGMSPSYLNEIEKGKKYPKAEKIVQLAHALDVPYDELVSLKLGQDLNPLAAFIDSPMIRDLPLQLFGISPREVIELIARAPKEAGALVRTLLEIARSYDVQVEQFYHAMVRSYQEAHQNYFEDIEAAADAFLAERAWDAPVGAARLRRVLEEELGYELDDETLTHTPELGLFRSVWVPGPPPRLLLNARLAESQQAFQMGREIGYQRLGLKERGRASSREPGSSFDQVLNDFKASYFAGALMIHRATAVRQLEAFFQRERWDAPAFLDMMAGYAVTPEMFLYRLSQIIPHLFGLDRLHFLRVTSRSGTNRFQLTKQFNMSRVLIPTGLGLDEHYCRRWLSVRVLEELEAVQQAGSGQTPLIGVQRSRFIDSEAEYFCISLARPLALTPDTNTSVTLGFQLNDDFKARVRFWDDPAVPVQELDQTCERCPLSETACAQRVAEPSIYRRQKAEEARSLALKRIAQAIRPASATPAVH